MKFGIVIAIYPRPDGKSPFYLQRCIDSVDSQTYKNYKLFVMGDKYGEKLEGNFEYEDLPYAYERDKYSGGRLWCCGGLNATNHGIKKAKENSIDYIIMLDYDDFWEPNHLQAFVDAGEFDWACTKSKHTLGRFFPEYTGEEKIINFLPKPSGVVKSSVCYNLKTLPFLPRLVFEEEGYDRASDWDLWFRQREYIKTHPELNLRSIFINLITCTKEDEGYARKAVFV